MISANVTWQQADIDRARRWHALGREGATVWLTGLPGAGKSTIAAAAEAELLAQGRAAYRLDGDNLRHGLCGDLGFSQSDREKNIWRVGQVARMFADAGTIALVAVISPYAACRAQVRELHLRDGLEFLEVFVDTPPGECARRDPKGLYARARAGKLANLTGVDDLYEPPVRPDLVLTPALSVKQAATAVLDLLAARLDAARVPAAG
jgi:adenylyl-sulfate kinase